MAMASPDSSSTRDDAYTSCTEVVTIAVNAAYWEDPEIVKASLDILASVEKVRSAYSGLGLGGAGNYYIFQEWDKIQDHHAFMSDKPTYTSLLHEVNRYMINISMMHVNFTSDPRPASSAPLTELTSWRVKDLNTRTDGEEKDREEKRDMVRTLVGRLVDVVNELGGGEVEGNDRMRGSYGSVVEDEDMFVAVIGWDSVEIRDAAFQSFGSASSEEAQIVAELRSLTQEDRRYIPLRQFK